MKIITYFVPIILSFVIALPVRAVSAWFSNRTPYDIELDLYFSDLMKNKVVAVSPHQELKIDFGNVLPTRASVNIKYEEKVLSSFSLKVDPFPVRREEYNKFYFFTKNRITGSGGMGSGSVVVYRDGYVARGDFVHRFRGEVGESETF